MRLLRAQLTMAEFSVALGRQFLLARHPGVLYGPVYDVSSRKRGVPGRMKESRAVLAAGGESHGRSPSQEAGSAAGGDALAVWASRTGRRQRAGRGCGLLRFAFCGRVSAEDHQDPVTSLARQREQAAALVAGHRRIVAESFDIGQSRTLTWACRPQAAALVAALADPERGVAIGSSRSGRSPGPGSGSVPQWRPRLGSKAATSAAARPTATSSPTPGRARTRRTRRGGGGRTGRNRIRPPRRSWLSCSTSASPGTASPGLPVASTTPRSRARRRLIPDATRTGAGQRGRWAR
jgi:hypothetical protein